MMHSFTADVIPEVEQKYLDSGGMACPFCWSDRIETVEWDPEYQSQEVLCNTCGRSWLELYAMTGIAVQSGSAIAMVDDNGPNNRLTIDYLEQHPEIPLSSIPTPLLEEWLAYNLRYLDESGHHNMGTLVMEAVQREIASRKSRHTKRNTTFRAMLLSILVTAIATFAALALLSYLSKFSPVMWWQVILVIIVSIAVIYFLPTAVYDFILRRSSK